VAYQGEPGAYSDEAVSALFPDAQAVGFPTFRLTFDALAMGAVEAAVLPVENSSAGVVQEVSDLLWELPGLRVVREHVQPVRHCLLGWKGSIAFVTAHRPGSLAHALDCFAQRGVNLTRLDSRPMMGRPFEYRFYLDFSINGEASAPAAAEAALSDLEEASAEIKLFGT